MCYGYTHVISVLHVLLMIQHHVTCTERTVLEEVTGTLEMNTFSLMLESQNLGFLLERPDITVFVPLSTAYTQFKTEAVRYGYNIQDPRFIEDVIRYHIVEGAMSLADLGSQTSIQTFHPDFKHLHFNSFTYKDSQIHTIDGVTIVSSDLTASNGVLHIIDRFLLPLQSSKTISQYLQTPDLPRLAFTSILAASIIDVPLKEATNMTNNTFTVFAPNDSYINTMPDYGQDALFGNWQLLTSVFWAHVIEQQTVYLPDKGDMPELEAKAGITKFYRKGGKVFVSNNKVRAEVVEANIPVANGVVHVIDDLLFYIYRNFKQKIDVLPNARFVSNMLNKVNADLQDKLIDMNRRMTFFLPTDEAFGKLPSDVQVEMDQNQTLLTKLLEDHMVMYMERDLASFQDGETLSTGKEDGKKRITITRRGTDVYVNAGGILALIVVPDIGCTNGVIHQISNVLFRRDFTLWEAIRGNDQLSKMREVISIDEELVQMLSTRDTPMTVFLISNGAFDSLPEDTKIYLRVNVQLLIEAVRGSIVHDVQLSSTQITEEMEIDSMAGDRLTLRNTEEGLYIIGTLIRANVVINDIWCSNGILHITDNILHIPTRTIADEIAVRPMLNTMRSSIGSFIDIQKRLSNSSRIYTMFVPTDEAFTYLPRYRAEKFQKNPTLLADVITAHIVPGTKRHIEEFEHYSSFLSEKGTRLFLLKSQDQVSVVSNNVKGKVIERNIRCTNGIIHVIDTMLDFPFWTVADVVERTPELRPFYLSILRDIDEFHSWSNMRDIQQTLFVPSAHFLTGLTEQDKMQLMTETSVIRKIFESHFLPGTILSFNYLDEMFHSSRVYLTENRYNVTFTLMDRDSTGKTELSSVDVGYFNLRETFDLIVDGIGCSNGVIYVINGFLNHPTSNILTELQTQPEIGIGSDQLIKLIPRNATVDLGSNTTWFTVFAPADTSFSHLTFAEISYINQNLTYTDRMEIVQRHIVRNLHLTYDKILGGDLRFYARDHNMSIVSKTDGTYILWQDVEAKIIRPNILATNGVIHVVDRLLLSTPYQSTTTTPLPTTRTQQISSSFCAMTSSIPHVIHTVTVFCLVEFLCRTFDLR